MWHKWIKENETTTIRWLQPYIHIGVYLRINKYELCIALNVLPLFSVSYEQYNIPTSKY